MSASAVKKQKSPSRPGRIDRGRIALVHVAKRALALSDDEYRLALGSVGAESAADLRRSQFDALMRHFEALGFVSTSAKKAKAAGRKFADSRTRLQGKIKAIMAELGLTDAYVNAMALTMFKINAWAWADAHQLHKLAAALTYYQQKRRSRAGEGGPAL